MGNVQRAQHASLIWTPTDSGRHLLRMLRIWHSSLVSPVGIIPRHVDEEIMLPIYILGA